MKRLERFCFTYILHTSIFADMAWLYKRGGKWWLGWRIGKRQFLKPTGETDRDKAKTQLETVERLEVAQKANALTEDYFKAATGNQFHFRELEDVRERGRIEAQDILEWARGQAAAANTEEKCLAVYDELRKRVTELEQSQHREFTKTMHPQKSRRAAD